MKYVYKYVAVLIMMGLFTTAPVFGEDDHTLALAKIAVHATCFGVTAYWVNHFMEHNNPIETVVKTAATLGTYAVYVPSIAILQAAISARKALKKRGIVLRTPSFSKLLPIILTALAGGYSIGLNSSVRNANWFAHYLKNIHTKLDIMPSPGNEGDIALLMLLGIWYNMTDHSTNE